MKITSKKKWLREIAAWLRKIGVAPVVGTVLHSIGIFNSPPTEASIPMILLLGGNYVLMNAIATWLEIKAEALKEAEASSIILPDTFGRREGRGDDSS